MRWLALALLGGLAACHAPQAQQSQLPHGRISAEPQPLEAADKTLISGVYTKAEKPKALILLFHQAGSGKDEYALIAPRLAGAGYSSLRIDARAGGNLYGVNETVQRLGKSAPYLEAKQDLEAALDWAKGQKLPVVLWGSSYSASLVFLLAAGHPGDVKAVMAFSPGEYFDDKQLVHRAAAKVSVPVFVTSAQTSEEIGEAKAILDAAASKDKVQYMPSAGSVHGSSTLLRAKNPGGAEPVWQAALNFLARVAP